MESWDLWWDVRSVDLKIGACIAAALGLSMVCWHIGEWVKKRARQRWDKKAEEE